MKGLIRVAVYDPGSTTLERVAQVRVGANAYRVETARRTTAGGGAAYLVALAGVGTREAADRLRGAEVSISRAEVSLETGEYLVGDLVGCAVVDPSGRPLGRVESLFHNGAQDILVLGDDRMIPLVPEWVLEVDLGARRVVVDPHEAD